MSYSVSVAIWCDGTPGVLCVEHSDWDQRGPTARETRRNLRGLGWTRRAGRDLCPDCANYEFIQRQRGVDAESTEREGVR